MFKVLLALAILLLPASALAQQGIPLPSIQIGIEEATSPREVSVLIELLLVFTVLAMAPAILLMMTCFTRLIVVFSFLRNAIGTQQMPPNQVLVGLAMFLTLFIMAPVFSQINQTAIGPYMEEEIGAEEALQLAAEPIREFMFKQTREKDLELFLGLARAPRPQTKDDVPTHILIPAFMISELKTAFTIGFVLFLPFLVIDMVVASVLLSMGMMMLPPIMVALPFKILLFVLVDGWYLIVGSLVRSFG
ncbi:flagellar type III secretion system pore protein FliP [Desulfurivibrio alkaliphilus]|uniref:Flagellar biosynthetic protein FliP n=1 Tax=Desulfurivibrio alkaliphilus (strain DSM 19089 / UNIQEM U267 / AHT2) TaxID=589865 RepID=D6Z4D5_DESAT|nr:flagellar type III secretion system pore protein FliP [Desulfurivibrio alkaliphilus]ADH86410.1 flagellar biosynthetic protein FliP [Desulfurivibrio alkaliphilus AHT 2]